MRVLKDSNVPLPSIPKIVLIFSLQSSDKKLLSRQDEFVLLLFASTINFSLLSLLSLKSPQVDDAEYSYFLRFSFIPVKSSYPV